MTYKTEALTAELMALQDTNGLIKPPEVVKWARRHTRSSLHSQLDWDNETAGEKYRIQQVRQLIALHIVDADGVRGLVSLSIDRGAGGYRQVSSVVKLPNLRAVMLEDAVSDLRRLQAKYQRLQELVSVWTETDKVEASMKGGRRRKQAA